MFANPEELLRYLKNEGVKFVDVRFCDLPGVMQHFTVPVESFGEDVFANGLAFDGSSIRGFQQIPESDMLLLPDAATAFVDPFPVEKTLAPDFFLPTRFPPRGTLPTLVTSPESPNLPRLKRHPQNGVISPPSGNSIFFDSNPPLPPLQRRAF